MILIIMEFNFLCETKDFSKIEKTTTFALTCFITKIE